MEISYSLPIELALSLTIRPQFAIERLGRSNQQGVGHFELAKFWEKGVDRCEPDVNTIGERHGAVVCKRNHVIFCISLILLPPQSSMRTALVSAYQCDTLLYMHWGYRGGGPTTVQA